MPRTIFEKPLRFLVAEDGGRLVEDEDAGAADEHLQDFDALLLGDRKPADRAAKIDLEADLLAMAADLGLDLAEAAGVAAARVGEEDVLERVERAHQLEVLVHHADAVGLGVERPADRHALAVHPDVALVRRVEAGGDVHQRGFAGAVLAEEGMHLAGEDGEIRRRKRHEAVERFRDSSEFEGRDHGRLVKTPIGPR